MSITEVVVIGDALVRRQAPLCSLDDLRARVQGHAGRRGFRTLSAALDLVRPRTDSPRETITRLLIVGAGLPEPVVNVDVRDDFDNFLGIGDLAYPQWKILIEYEGGYHFEGDQPYRDIDRLARFTAAGWLVIRVHKHHLAADTSLIAQVRAAIASRGG